MAAFILHFLICNLTVSALIGIFCAAKFALRNSLTNRMQLRLWYVLLVLLALPFLPWQLTGFSPIISRIYQAAALSFLGSAAEAESATVQASASASSQIQDFALSVSRETPSAIGLVLFFVWAAGILAGILLPTASLRRLHQLKKSALPLQNKKVRRIYQDCMKTMNLRTPLPLYSSAYLKSPVLTGMFRPRIYLPIHVISNYHPNEIRYMLYHELQHYKHRDAFLNVAMNAACILYWFNPLIWMAQKRMRCDRELACDSAVLRLLDKNKYKEYGNTLIRLAENDVVTPFPLSAGMSGSRKQLHRRIQNIATWQKPSARKIRRSFAAFGIIAALLLGFAPSLASGAPSQNIFDWNISRKQLSALDLSAAFEGREGSFVLYNPTQNIWRVYNREQAVTRISPDSTYKIYDALFALEQGILSPRDSFLEWDKSIYPFDAWNQDQNLNSAMRYSVNWYFQKIDRQLGRTAVRRYIEKIGYGNQNADADLSSYWMQSSLKISPVEQVQLLSDLYSDRLDFAPEHIAAVKESLLLASGTNGRLYGKTGTGCVEGHDVNGWFIGFVETGNSVWFFAANIQDEEHATGSLANEITMSVLSDLGIWESGTHTSVSR